jgi:nucleotide-binding universal stress UspA family protein
MAAVVCGVDGSAPARAAARLSAAIARRLGLELVLDHALPRAGDRVGAVRMLEELRRDLDVPTVRLRVDVGSAAERLTAASQAAALVVVGGANGQADRTTFGGSVRAALARHARCPVAVVPAVPNLGGSQVICGVRDWADVATATVATRFAGALGLPLLLMHVLPPAAGRGEALSASPLLERPWDHDTAYRLLELVADAVGGTPSLRVEPGTAARRLAHEAMARKAGLLVVGAPARGRLGAALTGSVSAHLMRRSQRPLVVCCGAAVPGLPHAS